jgi:hypothetical protein
MLRNPDRGEVSGRAEICVRPLRPGDTQHHAKTKHRALTAPCISERGSEEKHENGDTGEQTGFPQLSNKTILQQGSFRVARLLD